MPPTEKEKIQKLQERYQAILSNLLREEDNKYCVDCDAKGPRWASWNLGVFLCIRCAGIHRNLGVHISRVKSVNLDQWTAEQIASMQAMGNGKARDIYERNISENFRRSQTDSAMEQFIRAKYEQKKWIAKDWTPASITVSQDLKEDNETSKEKRKTNNSKITLGSAFDSPKNDPKKNIKLNNPISENIPINNVKESNNPENSLPLVDFGNETPIAASTTTSDVKKTNLGLFSAELFENSMPSLKPETNSFTDTFFSTNETKETPPQQTNNNIGLDLEGLLIGSSNIDTNSNKKIDKNSILALYSQGVNKAPTINNNNNSNNNNANAFGNLPQNNFKNTNVYPNSNSNFNPMNSKNLTSNQFQMNFPTKNPSTFNAPDSSFETQFSNAFNAPIQVGSNQQVDNKNSFMNFFDSPIPEPSKSKTFSTDLW